MARLDRGVDLVRAVLEMCNARSVRAGELRGLGSLEEVELREFDQRQRAWGTPRKFNTPSTIVQLYGNLMELDGRLHLEATCAVARSSDNGVEVVGGALVRARVHVVEVVVESFDDLLLRRTSDGQNGLAQWSEAHAASNGGGGGGSGGGGGGHPATATAGTATTVPNIDPHRAPAPGEARWDLKEVKDDREPEPEPEPVAAAAKDSAGWGQVIAVSAALPKAEEAPREAPIMAGDVLEHPRFGRCDVERIEGDGEFAQVRLRNGRLVRLSLDVLQFVRDGVDGERRRFRAVPPR